MLISEFARRAGLTPDAVRFYVRLGLLRPEASAKGGARPYQVFTAEHLQAAMIIRTAQSLGMSLKEIAAISHERRAGRMTRERSVEVLSAQFDRLERKAAELVAMKSYLQAKVAWLKGGEKGPPPNFGAFAKAA
ncbi:MAG TPA: MerR family transcriptional regulator [Phenylobacterium sp.]|jgi:MerR family copper efflux transcriptional regulator|nr:MerR family transcriptional regulator [Phenylobacterium sp.]